MPNGQKSRKTEKACLIQNYLVGYLELLERIVASGNIYKTTKVYQLRYRTLTMSTLLNWIN